MITFILLLIFAAVALLVYSLSPVVTRGALAINQRQANNLLSKADLYLQDEELQKAHMITIITPLVLMGFGFFLFQQSYPLLGIIVGFVLGIIIPKMYVSGLISRRKDKFNDQLVDALMIMSSSFRGGLSLVQAIEAVVEEMPDPIRREFGIVLGENKMGVPLEESFSRLQERMPSIALQQMITAILLARETGGNLPAIFSRIVGTIRERRKVEQNLQTLTIQGKIQAVVMTGLPVLFVITVSASNPRFFDIMLKLPDGRQLLMLCAFLWVTGAFFIWKISKFKDF